MEEALRKRGVEATRDLFKPMFVRDGKAASLMSGDWGPVSQLELTNRVDAVVLGRTKTSFSVSTELEGVVAANVHLELKCLRLDARASCGSRNIDVKGAGFS